MTLLLMTCLLATTPNTSEPPLNLGAILASVDQHHPKVEAAMAKEDVARAELFAARGGFDPKLSAYGALRNGGYYELRRVTAEIRQPTPIWGTELWVGYRFGLGILEERWPTYYEDETLDRGEVRAGLKIPVWRNGPLDKRRAKLKRARQKAEAAIGGRQATLLELRQKATDAYFAWAAAGRRLLVAQELLELAESRKKWVTARVDAGAIPPVEALEAERSVLLRRNSLVSARRGTEATSFILALFYRDDEGQPRLTVSRALPKELPLPADLDATSEQATTQALGCHPLLREQRALLAAVQVDQALAKAQNAPKIDIKAQISRDFGDGDITLPGTVFELGLEFEMPAAMRTPRGLLRASQAETRAVQQKLRFLEDSIRVRVSNSASAFVAAKERRQLAHKLAQNTRSLAKAEQSRFKAGATTLFVVNLREQSVAQAEIAEVDAIRDLWKARAEWDALTFCPSSRNEYSRNRLN